MELKSFLQVMRARWVGVLAVTLVGLALAFVWTMLQPRVYTADASGIVATEMQEDTGSSFTSNSLATSRVPSYVELGSLRSVAEFAIEELNLDTTPESLVNRVAVSNPAETLFIRVEAQGESPEQARDLAEVWIRGMEQEVNLLEAGSADAQGEIYLAPRDSARLPSSPSSPNTELALAVGLFVGLLGGVVYALGRNYLDRRIRSSEEVEKQTSHSVIGTVPEEKSLTSEDRLIIDSSTGGNNRDLFAIAEALRSLRTNIRFTDVDNPPRAVVMTSPLPGDGKSTIAANLALSMAASGQPTVLIDGDLRRPVQAGIFNIPKGAGLSDVLADRVSLEDALQPVGSTGNLLVLGAGSPPPNPSEILGSQRMRDLIQEVSEEAFLIIDAPPVVPVTDAAVLATATDGALLAATVGRTTYDVLNKALQNLDKVNGRALGVVLNRVPRRGMGAAYYGYQYYGDYYTSHSTEDTDAQPESAKDTPAQKAPAETEKAPTDSRRTRRVS